MSDKVKYISRKEAAKAYGVNPKTIGKWIKNEKLSADPSGRKVVVPIDLEVPIEGQEGTTPNAESPKVQEAKDARMIAEENAKKAEADRKIEAYKAGKTVEELDAIQRETLIMRAEVEQDKKDIAEEKAAFEQERRNLHSRISGLEESLKGIEKSASDEIEELKHQNGLLKKLLGVQEKQKAAALDAKNQYKNNRKVGIEQMMVIANGIRRYAPRFATGLQKRAEAIEKAKYEDGMAIFHDVHRLNCMWAEYFQDNKMDGFDGENICNWLCEMDDRICRVMAISNGGDTVDPTWEWVRENGENETIYKDAFGKEHSVRHYDRELSLQTPVSNSGMSKILDNIYKSINRG